MVLGILGTAGVVALGCVGYKFGTQSGRDAPRIDRILGTEESDLGDQSSNSNASSEDFSGIF